MNNIDFTHHQRQAKTGEACSHCLSVQGHEPWCETRGAILQYAFAIVADARKLTIGDALILHSLGVSWSNLAR